MGVDYNTFKHLNPTKLKAYSKAYKMQFENKCKEQELFAYWNGIYMVNAISSCFGKNKFPKKPIEFTNQSETDDEEMTEEQIKQAREKFILGLQVMQTNFELNKGHE